MEEQNFPTTDKYKLGVDIDLSLASEFMNAADGRPLVHRLPELIYGLVGRYDVGVRLGDDLENEYDPNTDDVSVNTRTDNLLERVCSVTGVPLDNPPPKIPDEYTAELDVFLATLHESEHAVQRNVKKDEFGYVDFRATTSTLVTSTNVAASGESYSIISEADADLPILEFLEREGMHDSAQFWFDMREVASFTTKTPIPYYPGLSGHGVHDTNFTISHHRDGGGVIDPEVFMSEKMDLMGKVYKEMGIGNVLTDSYAAKVADVFSNFSMRDIKDCFGRTEVDTEVSPIRPQKIMTALQNLLDEDRLDGVQELDAQNYMAAMGRLGYQPEPALMPGYAEEVAQHLENIIDEVYVELAFAPSGSLTPEAEMFPKTDDHGYEKNNVDISLKL